MAAQADLTLFLRKLGAAATAMREAGDADPLAFDAFLAEACSLPADAPGHDAPRGRLGRYVRRLHREPGPPEVIRERMRRANPRYVPRDDLAQEAIEPAEHGDLAARRPDRARSRPG